MNYIVVLNFLGRLLCLNGISMIPSLFISIFDKDQNRSFFAFLFAILIQAAVGLLIMLIKPKNKEIYSKEGFIIVAFGWILISLGGALPFYFSGYYPSFIDAIFESASGFTTTGATVCNNIEALSKSILFWRSFTHWLGGMGVLVLLIALAPKTKGSGMNVHILRAESPGPVVSKLAPKLSFTARLMYFMYIGLSVLEVLFLLIGKMPLFDAITNMFATAGTGGFSIKNSSIAGYSTYCQGVIAVFMLLFGINFGIYFLALIRDFKGIVKNTELRVYLSIIAFATLFVTVSVISQNTFNSFFEAFHNSFFTVVSIITTTGFTICDFGIWSEFTHAVLFGLMIIGAMAGSTGGGMKVSRIIIYFKSLGTEIKKILHPHSVSIPTIENTRIESSVIDRANGYLVAYLLFLSASILIVSLNGFDFKTTFSATLSCFNNVGPAIGEKIGPLGNMSEFRTFPKIVLILDMLFGRLEIYPLLLALTPSTWKR